MNRHNDRTPILDAVIIAMRTLGNARGLLMEAQSAADLRRVIAELERALAYTRSAHEACQAAVRAAQG